MGDGFELYDRTGEGKLYYNQVGDLIRGLGFKPTNANVQEALGNPKKEEMNSRTVLSRTLSRVSESSTRKATAPSWALRSDIFSPLSVRSSPLRRSKSSSKVLRMPTVRSTTRTSSRSS